MTLPTITFTVNGNTVTRPITDHPPIQQKTAWGIMASMNILNPGSPLAPSAQINGVTALPKEGKQQMEAMAEYIVQLFKNGVELLALQEVPNPYEIPHPNNHDHLINKLKALVGNTQLIDVDALSQQWLKTGTHTFGTSLLYNPNRFSINQNKTPSLDGRAAVYKITDLATSVQISIANVHGDFSQQIKTQQYINQFDGIAMGDANLRTMTPSQNPIAICSLEKPKLTIEGQPIDLNTFDFIQDTYSKKIYPTFDPNATTSKPIAQPKPVPRAPSIPEPSIPEPSIPKPSIPGKNPTPFSNRTFKSESNPSYLISVKREYAQEILKNFSIYLRHHNKQLLNAQRINDLELRTPEKSPTSVISISTPNVFHMYLRFQAATFESQKKLFSSVQIAINPSEVDQLKKFFHIYHGQMFKDSKQGFFGCFRNTKIKDNMSLKDIIDHAKHANNRSRQACIQLGWMDGKGVVNPNIIEAIRTENTSSHGIKLGGL